ncbi:MAG TPA: TonB-dependent receptor [Bryobacteraceae bacterium]|jgi:outer membrane cobalamin receptor|nr:TonB-dependent receptor [Bryobacteraceae bacterium]
MRTLILLILPLAACAGETSNIHGAILDPSGWPVEGARVTCGNQSVYSNAQGRFAFSSSDKCDAIIEKTGFQPQTVQLTAQTESKITLVVAGPVETVVVSATRTETTPEQAAVAASVITEQRLNELGYPMLSDVFRDIPGLQIAQYGPPGSLAQVFTRGAERTGTLVLVDGVPLNDPGGELHAEHLTSEGIERVEVVRGPQSALFGAEAAASVIQIFTKRGDPENAVPHGSVSYERGDFQTDRWIANLTGGFDGRLDYALSASGFHTAGEFQNQYDRDNTGTANIGYRLSDSTQLRGIFRVYDDHVGVPGQVAYGIDDPIPSEETRNQTVSLSLDDSRGSNFQQRVTFGFNKLRDRYNDDEPFGEQPLAALVRNVGSNVPRVYFVTLLNPSLLPAPSQIPPGLTLVTSDAFFGPSDSLNLTERKIAGYQGTLSYRGGALVFGYDYQNQSGFLSGTNASRNNNGFFANLQQSLGKRIFLSGGARLEHSSAFGTIGAGRGGVSFLVFHEHGPLSSAFFHLSGGRGVTEPSLLENFAQSPYYHGNPALRPEETTSFEAGLVAEWFGRRVRTEVSGFRNSFHNLIAFVGDSWQNIQASWARGVESSVQAKLPAHILLTVAYMWLPTRITSSASPESSTTGIGEELVHRPRNSGSVSFAITPRRFSFVLGGRFVGERQDADFTFGITRNPAYQFVYAAASYKATKHVTPVLRIDNLLNQRYEEVLGYQALSRSIIGGVRIGF